MSLASVLFLVLRLVHVLLAAVWIGVSVFVTFFLLPVVRETGPAAGPVMAGLTRRKFHVFIASIGGTTVLTGIYLYWRFTGGFDPALSATRAAMVFGTGGIAGIAALIVGGAVVSRKVKSIEAIAARLPSLAEAQRAAAIGEMAAAQRSAGVALRIVLVLQVIALGAMAIGHYV